MKAYVVSDANCDAVVDYVVFAETRGKAIRHALDYCDGAFDDYTWTEMRALRRPQLDKYYRGKSEMDWNDMADRVAMVRDANFRCSEEVDVTPEKCEQCDADPWCGRYESMTDGAAAVNG